MISIIHPDLVIISNNSTHLHVPHPMVLTTIAGQMTSRALEMIMVLRKVGRVVYHSSIASNTVNYHSYHP